VSLWLYDVAANMRHELARAGSTCGFLWPQFINARTVVSLFGSGTGKLVSFDIVTGRSHFINMHLPGEPQNTWLAAYAIASSTSTLAVLSNQGSNSFDLVVSSIASNRVLFKKELGFVCQCDGGPAPIELRWSRDGMLLAVDVAGQDASNLLYVYDRAGKRVRGPLNGNAPRWLGTSHSFLYQDYARGRLEWTKLDVTTGRSTPIPTQSGLTLPVLTPDGSRVAFNDDAAMHVVVYDFATRTETALAGRHAYPLWLDNDRVMLPPVRRCDCESPPYTPYGTADSVSVLTGHTVRTAMPGTNDADVWY